MDKIKYRDAGEMKDSGIEWLGMIPKEWEVTSLRQSLEKPITDGPHETPKYVDVGVPFISVDSLSNSSKIVNLDIVNKFISEEKFNEYNKKTQLKKNDILFSKSATIGKVAIVDDRKFMTWSPLAIIKSDAKKIYYKLLYYILSSERYINHITSLSNLNTQLNIGMKVLEKSKLATSPDLTEQQKIANFLDMKTAQLDSIISKKQLLIEKLEEAKKSLISEVVTGKVKIVDGQMVKRKPEEMKDSEIEWLGMIPKEWEVKKLKYITSKIGSGKTPKGGSEIYAKQGIMFLRSQNIHNDGLQLEDVVYIDYKIDKEMANTRVKENDILLNITGASIGRCALFNSKNINANVNQHVCIIRIKEDIANKEFYLFSLQSGFLQKQIMSYQTGSSREGLNFEQIKNLLYICPLDSHEQKTAVIFIQNKIQILNNTIQKIQVQIQKLEAAKQSLISEVVTGKIDLRDWEIVEGGEIM